MLEFLQECDQFYIVARAKDCEYKLNAFDCVTPIASFFESILKAHLAYFFPTNESAPDPNLLALLSNRQLMNAIRDKYGFCNVSLLHTIRKRSNSMKHDTAPAPISASDRETYFHCLFDFCSGYYTFCTGKVAPLWNESEYLSLLQGHAESRYHTSLEDENTYLIAALSEQLQTEQRARVSDLKKIAQLETQVREMSVSKQIQSDDNSSKEKLLQKLVAEAAQKQAYTDRLVNELAQRHSGFVEPDANDLDCEPKNRSIELTESQQQAVDCSDKYIVTVAGPGSGKTRVLTERITKLVIQDGVKENKILALSFSSKAANEVRKRLKQTLGIRASRIQAKTFHSFGLGVIRQNCDLLGYHDGVEIINSTGKYRILRNLLNPKSSKTSPVNIFHELTSADIQYYAQEISRIKAGEKAIDQSIQQLCNLYNQELKRGGYIDFDDMVGLPRKLFMTYPDIRAAYKQRFEHVLIDEVQDVNAWQVDMIRGIVGPQTNLFVVGDDDQCIYEWRGAIPSYIKGLVHNDAFTVIRLGDNFRSETAIVKASASFISRNLDRIEKSVHPRKKRNTSITSSTSARWLRDVQAEAQYIAKTINDLVLDGTYNYADITILARSHKQFQPIINALNNTGIPVHAQNDESHYDRFIHVLQAISDIKRQGTINRAVNYPNQIMDNFLYQDLRETFHIPNEWSVYEAFEYLCVSDLRFDDCELFRSRFELIRELNAKASLLTVSEIIRRLYDHYMSEEGKQSVDQSSMYAMLELAVDFDKGYTPSGDESVKAIDSFLDFIRLSQEDDSANETDEDAVTLMTCHRSKGLEFPVVFIPGVQCGTFPDDKFINTNADLEAERRLLYVSMTRAIDKLYLTCNDDPYRGDGRHQFKGFLADIPDILMQKS